MPHIHDKIDFTAEAFIVYKNRVLLRKHDKYKIWLSVGGHIELDEEPNEAVIREVKEEVGLNVELFYKENYSLIEKNQYKPLIPQSFSTYIKSMILTNTYQWFILLNQTLKN
ncbi:MAG: NUDIX domain-containing protein [Nanoarchaeota archaeon]